MKRVVFVAALLVALFIIGWENYDLWWRSVAPPQEEEPIQYGRVITSAETTFYRPGYE